jgi:hypothetical protein
MVQQAGGESAAEKVLSAVDHFVENSEDDGFIVVFLNHQLEQWEGVSRHLEHWLSERGKGNNPYSPPIDLVQAQCVIGALEARLTEARQRIARKIAQAQGTYGAETPTYSGFLPLREVLQ